MKSRVGWLRPVAAVIVLLGLWSTSAQATYEEHIALGKASFRLASDKSDSQAFFQALRDFQTATETDPNHPLGHYYVALTDWRLARQFSERGASSEQVEMFASEGVESCDRLLSISPDHAEALALKGSLLAILSTTRANDRSRLGTQSVSNIRRACEISPRNPRVWLFAGIASLEQPGVQNNTEGALRDLRRALEIFERDESLELLSGGSPKVGRSGGANPISPPEATAQTVAAGSTGRRLQLLLEPDWGHDEAWVWAGKAHLENANLEAARRCFIKALQINPANTEVKEELLPDLEESMTNEGETSSSLPQGLDEDPGMVDLDSRSATPPE